MIRAFKRSLAFLSPREKSIFVALLLSRVTTNFLDVLGLVSIGVLGTMLAAGLTDQTTVSFFGFEVLVGTSGDYLLIVTLIAGFFLGKSLIATLLLRASSRFLAKVEARVASDVARFIYSGSLERLERFSRGDIQFALTTAPNQAISVLLMSGAAIATEGALFASVFLVFVFVDGWTAMFISLYFVVLLAIFQVGVDRRLRSIGERLTASAVSVGDTIYDMTHSFRELSVFSKTERYLQKFSKFRLQNALDTASAAFLHGLPRFFVEAGLMLGVLALIGFQFLRGNLGEGLVTTAVFLAGGVRMMGALLPLQVAIARIRTFAPQAEIAHNLVEEAIREKQGDLGPQSEPRSDSRGGLDVWVNDVHYSHGGSQDWALRGVSLKIESGQQVALVGPSGAGKTTLVDVILGLHQPQKGEILLGGVPPVAVRNLAPGSISYVPQSPGLVTGTIAENVALGVVPEDIDTDRVWACLESAELGDFVRQLPFGVESSLGKQAGALSGGQKQRIGLARALYSNPKLLILDEATSALDAVTESNIAKVVDGMRGATTVIVIAHRLSTVQNADKVCVIEEGVVTHQGGFQELRRNAPLIEKYIRLMEIPDS